MILSSQELIVGPLNPKTGLPDYSVDVNSATWPYTGRKEAKSFLYEIIANKQTGKFFSNCKLSFAEYNFKFF